MNIKTGTRYETVSDEEIVENILKGQKELYEIIIRRHNQKLYRIACSISGKDNAPDIMQQAYINAYRNMSGFRKGSKFSTWLARILINEALAYLKQNNKVICFSEDPEGNDDYLSEYNQLMSPSPEEDLLDCELTGMLEIAVSRLPDIYRAVYIMREVEGMSTLETAECLDISEANVKVRLNRAREMLRQTLKILYVGVQIFHFNLIYCDSIAYHVMKQIKTETVLSGS